MSKPEKLDPLPKGPWQPSEAAVDKGPTAGECMEATTLPPENLALSPAPHSRTPESQSREEQIPQRIGRYGVMKLLGEGGFGAVYLAHDDELKRQVAIKVPHRDRIANAEDAEAYLAEARILASLNHPHIVPVHDVGRTEDGLCFIVTRFIEGADLARHSKHARLPFAQAIDLVAAVAEALHYAHKRGLVHRDVKPANILIDQSGTPYLVDFGLALKEEDYGRGGGILGTPAYMSPEQANGEGHRVDGRSDIFSLGVLFYELLTGRRPFVGDTVQVLIQIVTNEPRPPRQIDDTIPKELERVCLKALSKRARERYTTAKDMADDLRHFLVSASAEQKAALTGRDSREGDIGIRTPGPVRTPSDQQAARIVPKGLRSFDAGDADFFLELLPGPRDRDGLPESIRFWKRKIETTDANNTFAVGLMYGPSGCGKSSLVKAGLLPRLAKSVTAVYIEAAGEETEARLLKNLRHQVPDLPTDLDLIPSMAALRRGSFLESGQKVLLVLDQFEQWLHAKRNEENTELVQAVRQCDGGRVQAIVMVRDDFWMAATRFMAKLDITLVQGQNCAAVDLFDVRHTKKVLTAFGRTFAALSEKELTKQEDAFLDQAVVGLAQDGKVISVRLILFVEMIKGRPWTPATLKEVGGMEGLGVTFLEETFTGSTAPPQHRLHQKAAQGVLKALLPETGTDIRGNMRSQEDLLSVSGYATRPADFEDLLRILDGELRLIAPTDPEAVADSVAADLQSAEAACDRLQIGCHYQLTHDYLVPSLRDWLTRKQKETRRGRAQLLLADGAAVWNARPENRQLPSLLQWLRIHMLTARKSWSQPQRKMMRRATRYHTLRAAILMLFLLAAAWGSHEAHGRLRARILRDRLLDVTTAQVPEIIKDAEPYRQWLEPLLQDAYGLGQQQEDARKQLHASLALAAYGKGQADYLHDRLLTAAPQDAVVIREVLNRHNQALPERLWTELQSTRDPGRRLRAACGLARFAPQDARWAEAGADVVAVLVAQDPVVLATWIDALRPVADRLLPSLAALLEDDRHSAAERRTIVGVYADYAAGRSEIFARLEARLQTLEASASAEAFQKLKGALSAKDRQQIHEIVLAAGRTYTIDLHSTDFDTYLKLLDPQGKLLAENDDADEYTFDARLIFTATTTGNYQLVASAFENEGQGAYTLTIRWQRGAALKACAHVASALLAIGRPEKVWPLLKHGPDPSLRSFVIEDVAQVGPEAKSLLEQLDVLGRIDNPRYEKDVSIRRALILALGGIGPERWPAAERELQVPKFVELYRADPDPGVHGAADWLLRSWKPQGRLSEVDSGLMTGKPEGKRRWYVNRQAQTMVVIPRPDGGEPLRGDLTPPPANFVGKKPREEKLDWSFAISAKEVTEAQFQKCPAFQRDKSTQPSAENPVEASWYEAAEYCNWLSAEEGIPKEQWCYLRNPAGKYAAGMKIAPDFLKRSGYRLPTEAEWEYACRAGSVAAWSCGDFEELVGRYGWHYLNSRVKSQPVGMLKPNDFGLFDMHGDAWEWCQDRFDRLAQGVKKTRVNLDINLLDDENVRVLRGGSFVNLPGLLGSAFRSGDLPSNSPLAVGFRVARTFTAQ